MENFRSKNNLLWAFTSARNQEEEVQAKGNVNSETVFPTISSLTRNKFRLTELLPVSRTLIVYIVAQRSVLSSA